MPRSEQSAKGFTLIEVVIAIGIFILVMVATINMFLFVVRSQRVVFDQLAAQSQGRLVLQNFVTEMRSANYSTIGAYPLLEASSSEIIFYSDINKISYVERVRYTLTGNKLIKGVIEPTGTPLDYLTANETTNTVVDILNNTTSTPLFSYYDQNFTGASSTALAFPIDVTKVRVVSMNLRIDKDPTKSPVVLILQAEAQIRNLKSN